LPTPEAFMAKRPVITVQLQKFRETKNVVFLLRAVLLVMRQQRFLELLYGLYCNLFYRPSDLHTSEDQAALIAILKERSAWIPEVVLFRDQLVELYGGAFKIAELPPDFLLARRESVWLEGKRLIIGEYGENSRIACVTPESCVVSSYYRQVPGVRHIHAVEPYGDSGEFLVSTGDSCKFLDLWVVEDGKMSFVTRLSSRLAGYTAAARVNGEYYFGTDFSSRPNFITTLGGAQYFFPSKAYNLHVTSFHTYFDRYIVSINSELEVVGGRRVLSIFDTVTRRFIYCEDLTGEDGDTQRAA
jgi:hypothetical protein